MTLLDQFLLEEKLTKTFDKIEAQKRLVDAEIARRGAYDAEMRALLAKAKVHTDALAPLFHDGDEPGRSPHAD